MDIGVLRTLEVKEKRTASLPFFTKLFRSEKHVLEDVQVGLCTKGSCWS
jgi:hypothetical protein